MNIILTAITVAVITAVLIGSVLCMYTEAKTKTKKVHVDIEGAEHGMDRLKLCPSLHGKHVGDCKRSTSANFLTINEALVQ